MTSHLRRPALIFFAAAILAGCQTTGGGASDPDAPLTRDTPGTTIRIRNADPAKWDMALVRPNSAAAPNQGAALAFRCKPLACAAPSIVLVESARSPTRSPEPKALEQAARLMNAQAQSENIMLATASEGQRKIDALGAGVTRLRGFPAIVAERRVTNINGKPTFQARADVFVGAALVRVVSVSEDRALAKRNMNTFVEAVQIADRAE
jgi:hypothetical protein